MVDADAVHKDPAGPEESRKGQDGLLRRCPVELEIHRVPCKTVVPPSFLVSNPLCLPVEVGAEKLPVLNRVIRVEPALDDPGIVGIPSETPFERKTGQ